VAIYDRLSKDRTGEADSVENRIGSCRKYIEAHGWEIVEEPFIDRDISGYHNKKRPAFERVLTGIEAGTFDAVCVWKIDRFGRRMVTAINNVQRITDSGGVLMSVSDNVDTSTAIGRGVLALMFSLAEGESESTSKRVSLAWEAVAAEGRPHIGGVKTFGFTKDCQQIPAEAAEGRWAAEQLLSGRSLNATARELNHRAQDTGGKKNWTGSSLKKWALCGKVAGLRDHRGLMTEGTWEGIITPAEREQLLVLVGTTSQGGGPKSVPLYLLVGLVRCSQCHQAVGVKHGGGGTRNYGCKTNRNPEACGKVTASVPSLDRYITEELLAYLARGRVEPVGAAQDPKVLEASIETDTERLAKLNRARFVDERISDDEWQTARDELQERIETAKGALAALETGSHLRVGDRDELDAWWAGASLEERRAAIKDAFHSITLSPATKRAGPKLDTDRVTWKWRTWSGTGRRIMEKVSAEGWEPTEADLVAYAEAQAEESERADTSRTHARFRKGADGKVERIA
jgi:DNA invertase Pin-like site-specific DNA recombinase